MERITIKKAGGRLLLTSPYNPDFPRAAHKLGGKWKGTSKTWTFDARDEERVRELVRKYYGTDGEDDVELVTVRVALDSGPSRGTQLWIGGREVARVFERDGGARLGDGVVVLSGSLGSTGSRKHPAIAVREGTVIEIRDLPVPLAREIVEGGSGLEGGDRAELVPEVVGPKAPSVETLKAEREHLIARIIEIDALIADVERGGEKLPDGDDPAEPVEVPGDLIPDVFLADPVEASGGDPTPPPAPAPKPAPKPPRAPGEPMSAAEFFGRE